MRQEQDITRGSQLRDGESGSRLGTWRSFKLLRPYQDSFTRCVLVVDNQRRSEPLEIFSRELQIFEVEVSAVQIDRRTSHLHPHQPERNAEADHPLLVGIECEDVDRFR